MFILATGFLSRSLPIAIRDSMFSLVAISTDDVSPFNESSYTHIMHMVIVDYDKLWSYQEQLELYRWINRLIIFNVSLISKCTWM
jgi:tagatose-1,6-bisphosphate aldolase non-catalytic subunit AgaZ/GatZ